ncbi:MAG: hypothetical protein ACI9UO_002869 [Nitrospinales bacterium]|jgi:hypothetical protein
MVNSILSCDSARFGWATKRRFTPKAQLNLDDIEISVDIPSLDGNHFKY